MRWRSRISLRRPGHAPAFRGKDATAQNRRDFDLDLGVPALDGQLGRHVFPGERNFGDARADEAFSQAGGETPHRRVNAGERVRPARDREVGQIDIDGQPGQVAQKEIDRGTTLQREIRFLRDERQNLHEERDLGGIAVRQGHRDPPGP